MLLTTSLPQLGLPSRRLLLARFLLRPQLLTRGSPLPGGEGPCPVLCWCLHFLREEDMP